MANDSSPTPQPGRADAPNPLIQARHDLRNPLGHIMGFAELLLDTARKQSCAPALEDLAFLCRQSEAMISRVNLCLDPHNVGAGLSDLAGLLLEIDRFCAAAQAATHRLRPVLQTWADPAVLADLDRIADSAQRMQAVAAARLPGLDPGRERQDYRPEAGRAAAEFAPEGLSGRDWSVLSHFLPRFVIERLQHREAIRAECFPEVTLLAACVAGVEQAGDAAAAQARLRDLQKAYAAFDSLCATHQVETISVSPRGYLAAAGFPFTRADHAAAAAELAWALQEQAAQGLAVPQGALRLRLALATGPVVAGLTGLRRISFDLWGPTVDLAWRLAEQAPPGGTLVSPSTQARLPQSWQLEPAEAGPGQPAGSASAGWLLRAGPRRQRSSGHEQD